MKRPIPAFDWNQARAFLATAEEGSLSAAARKLGQTQPTIGRQVSALEDALGITLFERIGRALTLTEAGLDLLDHVRGMGDAAAQVALAATGRAQEAEGLVTLSATDVMAAYILPPVLKELRTRAPGIEIRVICTNSLSDLRRREADIAIRHVQPDHPDLYARKLREEPARIYGARGLLEQLGRPLTVADTGGMEFVGYDNIEELAGYLVGMGLPVTPANIRISSPSGVVAWQMVRDGLGLGIMADDIAARCPDVVNALPDLPPVTFPIWLVAHRELQTSRRIRIVFDHLAEGLGRRR